MRYTIPALLLVLAAARAGDLLSGKIKARRLAKALQSVAPDRRRPKR